MAFRIRTVETTAQGRSIVRDRDFAGARITIGRAADNDLHLPDLALDAHHAAITARDDGRIAVEALGTLGFTLDGKQAAQVSIAPATGGELQFGSYRVTVSRDSDGAVLLTTGQIAETEEPADEKSAFSIASRLPGKRAMSWLFALLAALTAHIISVFFYW